MSMTEERIVTKFLKHTFSEEERKVIADQLAQAVADHQAAEDQLRAVRDQFKSRISEAEAKISGCAQKLNSGFEMRDTECRMVKDYRAKEVSYIRLDTGEIAEIRTMTAAEAQMELGEQAQQNEPETAAKDEQTAANQEQNEPDSSQNPTEKEQNPAANPTKPPKKPPQKDKKKEAAPTGKKNIF